MVNRRLQLPQFVSIEQLGALLLALTASFGLVLASEFSPIGAILLVGVLPAMLVLSVNPRAVTLITLFAFIIFDEFPSGLGETAERSIRTPFYATSLGIPGLYPPDVLVFSAISLFLIHLIIRRETIHLPHDRIQWALILIFAMVSISAVLSLASGNPFHSTVAMQTSTVYQVNDRGMALIALFQFKNFSFLLFAYLLSLFYLKEKRDIELILKMVFIAAVINIVFGIARFSLHPEIIAENKPLFYDSTSSWLFALFIFYWVYKWITRRYTHVDVPVVLIIILFLTFFILLSFRRTMWMAIAISMFVMIPLIPRSVRTRYYVLIGIVMGLIVLVMLLVPKISMAILARIQTTSGNDLSTLYRLALFVWFRHNIDVLPLFGYGLRPMWDIVARLGYFCTNLENIHSLYFWILLKTGIIGFLTCASALMLIIQQLILTAIHKQHSEYHGLVVCTIFALVMLLFSGIFNPIYAETRYMVLMGFMLGFISKLPILEKKSHDSPM